jgi:tetratricopeptide (TPR) repeat protein
VVAAAADFYVEHELPARSLDFVKKNQALLEQTAAGMVAMGKSLLVGGETQRAIAMLTRAVARGPSDLEADFELGKAFMLSDEFSQACDVFNRLVKYRPDCPRFYALLGASYRRGGLLMDASRVLEYGNKTYPGNIPMLVNLAQTYIDLGWYDRARQILVHAQDLDPDLPDIYVSLGVLAWHEGKLDDANRLLEKAAHMGTNVQSALNNEGNILYMNGKVDKALDEYKKADRAGAKNESVLSNLANAYRALGRPGDAAASLEALLSLSPERLDVLEELASLAEKRGKAADAVTYYRRVLELSPHDGDALVKMVTLMIKLGEYKGAVDPLEAYLADYPADKRVLLMQADLYRRMGWYEVALMKYRAITSDFASDAEGFLGMGRTLYDVFQFKNGTDFDNAITCLKKALELSPSNPEPEYLLGLIYMNCKGNPDLARDQWRAALSKATDPVMKTNLTELIEKAGK